MDPNNEREPEEIMPQPMEEGEDVVENAEGDAGHMEDRGDGVHFERADDQGHGDTGSPSTAWNDPPRLAARPATALPRRNLTRRVAFLLGTGAAAAAPAAAGPAAAIGTAAGAATAAVAAAQGPPVAQGSLAGTSAVPVGFNQNDVDLLEVITTLNNMLGTSCLVQQVNKLQEYWVSSVCTADMKDTVLKMTRHIRERQYREAELLHAILALNPAGGWFALYFRQIINLLRDGISAEPNKDLLDQ